LIFDLEREEGPLDFIVEVCVIGAGAAGIVLALELARRGRKVMLLESGGRKYEAHTQALYGAESVGLPYVGYESGRVRVLGGTTVDWGGQIVEIDEHVFNERTWIEGAGWPLAKRDLKPHFARALVYEGLAEAPDPSSELPTAPPSTDIFIAATKFCPCLNFFNLYRAELEASKDIAVLSHANVVDIAFNDEKRLITGVACKTLSGREIQIAAPRFVLCVGGIETSRLLLQPRAGGFYPWQASGLLGRSYVDHIVATTIDFPSNFALGPGFEYFSKGGVKFHPKIKISPELQAARAMLDAAATISPIHRGGEKLAAAFDTYRLMKKGKFDQVGLRSLLQLVSAVPELAWHRLPIAGKPIRVLKPVGWRMAVHCEQLPLSGGSITLGVQRDSLGLIRARIDWRIDDAEIHTIRETTQMISATFAALPGGVGTPLPKVEIADRLRAASVGSNHHIGGARMSISAKQGVVDPQLRVFGVNNFDICSTAVFPAGGFANPTHTLLALTLRLADRLIREPVHAQ
jgi:choline dehydrogenase-like flavoprotein